MLSPIQVLFLSLLCKKRGRGEIKAIRGVFSLGIAGPLGHPASAMALALMAGVGTGAASSSTKPSSASKVKKAPQKMDSKKANNFKKNPQASPPGTTGGGQAFEIPGLQARPYHDDELQAPPGETSGASQVAFEIIDLDRHGEIGATDLRRALQQLGGAWGCGVAWYPARLCGEPEPTDAEIQEMIRLMDPEPWN
eukprot:Skav224413  [mRNA]  locus=scaffold657:138119:142432:+ [translate_table: standard]